MVVVVSCFLVCRILVKKEKMVFCVVDLYLSCILYLKIWLWIWMRIVFYFVLLLFSGIYVNELELDVRVVW